MNIARHSSHSALEVQQNQYQINPWYLLRGIACLGVVTYHVQAYLSSITLNIFGVNLRFIYSTGGPLSVWAFFVMSGYFIGQTFTRGKYNLSLSSLMQFYKNRIKKVLPAYYAVIIFFCILFLNKSHAIEPSLLVRLLVFQSTIDIGHLYVGYLWYVSAQMQLYVISPILFIILKYTKRNLSSHLLVLIWIVCLSIIVKSILLLINFPHDWGEFMTNYYAPFYMNIDSFAFGFAVNLVAHDGSRSNKTWNLGVVRFILGVLLVLAIIFGIFTKIVSIKEYYYNFIYVYVLLVPVLIQVLVGTYIYISSQKIPTLWKSNNIFVNLTVLIISSVGKYSYEIYLLHYIIIFYLNRFACIVKNACTGADIFIRTVIILFISIGIAMVFKNGEQIMKMRISKSASKDSKPKLRNDCA